MADTVFLALDITVNSVSGALFSESKRGPVILHTHVCALGESVSVEDALAEVFIVCGGDAERCLVSLGVENFHFRQLHIPFRDRKKVRSVVPFEIEDSASFQEEPFLFDYVIQPADEGTEGTDIFAVMTERQVIAQTLERLQDYGLDPELITVSGLPEVWNICRRESGNLLSFALIHIEAGRAAVFVVVDNEIKMIRSLSYDGIDALSADIDHTLLAAASSLPEDVEIAPMFAGSVGSNPQVQAIINSRMYGTPREKDWAGSIAVDSAGSAAPGQSEKGRLDNVLALVHCHSRDRDRINLRAGEFTYAGRKGRYARYLKIGAAAVVAMLAGTIIYEAIDFKNKERQREELTARIETLYQETVTGSTPGPDPVKQLQVKINELNEASATGMVHDPSLNTLTLLADISARIPQSLEVSFERLIYDRKTIRIKGLTDNFNTVDQIKNSLVESPHFSEVTIGSANVAPKEDGIRFELKLLL